MLPHLTQQQWQPFLLTLCACSMLAPALLISLFFNFRCKNSSARPGSLHGEQLCNLVVGNSIALQIHCNDIRRDSDPKSPARVQIKIASFAVPDADLMSHRDHERRAKDSKDCEERGQEENQRGSERWQQEDQRCFQRHQSERTRCTCRCGPNSILVMLAESWSVLAVYLCVRWCRI